MLMAASRDLCLQISKSTMQQQQTFMLSFRFYPRNRHHMHCTAAHSDFFRVVRIIQHLKKSRVGWLPYIKILRIQDYSNNWVQTRLQIDAFKHSCSTLKWNDLANLYSRFQDDKLCAVMTDSIFYFANFQSFTFKNTFEASPDFSHY